MMNIVQKMMATNYSCGIERDEKQLKKNNNDPTKWSNPLEARLVTPFRTLWRCVADYL